MLRQVPIGPLRRFWALKTQRIIPATALIDDLRKRINAQRLGLSISSNAWGRSSVVERLFCK